MRNEDLVKIISITLALVSLITCLFIWGQISGFEKGYLYGVIQSPPRIEGISGQEVNFFQIINSIYLIISLGFCAYIIGKFLKSLVISSVICMVSLSVVVIPLYDILRYKNDFLPVTRPGSDVFWLNNSIYFDWFFLFATVTLMFVQITLINTRKLDTETLKIN
jgi:hypothetical protein